MKILCTLYNYFSQIVDSKIKIMTARKYLLQIRIRNSSTEILQKTTCVCGEFFAGVETATHRENYELINEGSKPMEKS